jgi:uncharacterized protein
MIGVSWSVVGPLLFLVVAGVLAGALATAGGIASLVSYPALLLVGVPALPANVVNIVAFAVCGPGSALTSRRELGTVRRSLLRGLPLAAGGAVAGSLLLVFTPAAGFARVVPFLVLAGPLALVAQPWLTARRPGLGSGVSAAGWVLIGLVSVYAGYFGAGSGVLMLATVLLALDPRLLQANALKNTLVGVTALAATVTLVLTGPVEWAFVVPLAAGLFGGSLLGPLIARRIPPVVMRSVVVVLGVALAVELWVHPG